MSLRCGLCLNEKDSLSSDGLCNDVCAQLADTEFMEMTGLEMTDIYKLVSSLSPLETF